MFLQDVLWVARQARELVIFSLIFPLGLIDLEALISECKLVDPPDLLDATMARRGWI